MNAVVEQQDAERMAARIDALEFLVRQQKEFIEESATTWRGLLEREQALGAQGWRERNELDARFRALNEEQAAHVQKVHDLQDQVRESHRRLKAAEETSVAQMNDRMHSAQTETAELNARLIDVENSRQESDRAREQAQDRLKELTDQLSKVDNMLRQRQEETEQAWNALAEHRARVAELEANLDAAAEREVMLEKKLKDSDSWVFKLAGERTGRERQLELLIRERNSTTEKLAVAHKKLASLRKRLDLLIVERSELVRTKDANTPSETLSSGREDDHGLQSPSIGTEKGEASVRLETDMPEVFTGIPLEDAISPSEAPAPAGREDGQGFQPSSAGLEKGEASIRLETDGQKVDTATPPRAVWSQEASPTSHSPQMDVLNITPAINTLMKPVIERNKKMFLDQLIGTNSAPQAVSSIPSVSTKQAEISAVPEQPLQKAEVGSPHRHTPMRMTVPARNPQLERQVKAAEIDIRWLREVSLASLDMPKRWSFLPLSWHLSRIKERFSQKGLFDELAYLAKNPDVAEASIDPLIHYLKHGMDEGRER